MIGEIALGSLSQRTLVLSLLEGLPEIAAADHEEVMGFMVKEKLYGIGIGYVDLHLLASVRLQPGTTLWTKDKRLAEAAKKLDIVYS